MAFDTLTAPVGVANPAARIAAPSPFELARIRAALVERINATEDRVRSSRTPWAGMPTRLLAAGCYLAAHGFNDEACGGER